jgi:diguanylate cyclase
MKRMRSSIDYKLGWIGWLVLLIGLVVGFALTGLTVEPNRIVILVCCVLFFGLLLSRLVLAMRREQRGRLVPGILAVGIVLWATESAVVTTHQGDSSAHLTAGEGAYLVTYLVFAVYVLLDSEHRPTRAWGTWLETAVICGGTASLAGTLLLTPLASRTSNAASLLVALLYPVADVMLMLLVVAQIGLRMRSRNRNATQICFGFLLLALADASFVGNVQHGSEGSSLVSIVLWAAGFAQLVSAACRRPTEEASQAASDVPGVILAAAAVIAISVLVLRPDGGLGVYLAAPAVITLVAGGGRMLLALRDARGAAEAVALARTDDLTMLPNRRAMLWRIDEDLAAGRPLALMLMDLNGFKDINDTLGHASGDIILQMSGRRIRTAMPASVFVGRLGGDEFGLVVADEDEIRLMETANLALAALRQPTLAHGIELVVDAAVGITIRGPDDEDSSGLLRRADVAMYQAKSSGVDAVIYDPSRDEFSRNRLQMAEELRRGIAEGELVLWYQPQIEAATQEICGLEALVRWQHPERGLLPPIVFLPIAQHAGLMPALSDAVIKRAALDVKSWRPVLAIRVALNCPPPELLSGVFLQRLLKAAEENGLDPTDFLIEVTEDSFLADPERARGVVQHVRDQGIEIAIDDYGTGFSSLAYLRDLPIDELKIDRSFISAMGSDQRSRMIVESTVKMAHGLELRVVAEGVEDAATAAMLVAMGADAIQGYHFARPMPADQVAAWVLHWRATLADFSGLGGRGHRV